MERARRDRMHRLRQRPQGHRSHAEEEVDARVGGADGGGDDGGVDQEEEHNHRRMELEEEEVHRSHQREVEVDQEEHCIHHNHLEAWREVRRSPEGAGKDFVAKTW